MTGIIEEQYWNNYYKTHNERRFDALVNNFYADDAVFENPKVQAFGRKQILAFFENSNRDVHIELIPRAILIDNGVTATELDCVIAAQMDLPDFLLGPMKKGGTTTIRMAAVYHLKQDLISRASIYWGRQVD